jgi:hypothetical protein
MREQRQKEAVEAFLASDGRSILNCCPRFGKIKVALDILKKVGYNRPAILAPRTDIFDGWENDMDKFGYGGKPLFYTYRSIKKVP